MLGINDGYMIEWIFGIVFFILFVYVFLLFIIKMIYGKEIIFFGRFLKEINKI